MVQPSICCLPKKHLFPHKIDLVEFLILFGDSTWNILGWIVLVFARLAGRLGLTLPPASLTHWSNCQRNGISRQGRHALDIVQASGESTSNIKNCKFKVQALIYEHMHISLYQTQLPESHTTPKSKTRVSW